MKLFGVGGRSFFRNGSRLIFFADGVHVFRGLKQTIVEHFLWLFDLIVQQFLLAGRSLGLHLGLIDLIAGLAFIQLSVLVLGVHHSSLFTLAPQFLQLGSQRSIHTLFLDRSTLFDLIQHNALQHPFCIVQCHLLHQISFEMMLVGRNYLLHEEQITRKV